MFIDFKGQGMIGEIIIFSMAIFMALVMFILLSSGDAEFEQNVNLEIESGMESITDRSVLTVILNDHVWRAPTVDERYNDLTALELTSHYFSTDEDVKLHGESFSRDAVETDLQEYYSYKMRRNFLGRPEQQDFFLNITNGNNDYIEVDGNEGQDGSWNSIRLPFQLSDGENGEITMWFRGTGGVFQVE